jgi:hypothetical protein
MTTATTKTREKSSMSNLRLLTREFGNPKLEKSSNDTDYVVCGLHLAPYTLSGFNVCGGASPGCIKACLNVSGRGKCYSVQNSRVKKTRLFFEDRELFKKKLVEELHYFAARCSINGWKPACRLNITSDVIWEKVFPELFAEFPTIQFYDYTKIEKRVVKGWQLPKNYHLTFSRSEVNDDFCKEIIKQRSPKINIVVVFGDSIPKKWSGRNVILGDYSDLRFMDPKGVIIALSPKGKAKHDVSGFVVRQ